VNGKEKLNNRFLYHYLTNMNFIPFLTGKERAKLTKAKYCKNLPAPSCIYEPICYNKGAAGGLSVIPPLVPYLTNHQKESSRMVPPGGNIIESRQGFRLQGQQEKNRQRD